jgi:hypothetical protein
MIVAIAMVRDEADIVRDTVGHMTTQVDHVIVVDNGSVDGTRDLLEGLAVEVLDDPEPAYYQSQKMTALAMRALERGATWVVPFDADEMHWATGGISIAETLRALPAEVLVSEAKLHDHVATAAYALGVSPVERMPWRRNACSPLRKIAARARPDLVIEQGNHGARFEKASVVPMVTDQIEVRHFPYRSVEQFVRKVRNGAAAYAATDLPESVGAHWRQYGQILEAEGEEGIANVFHRWFWSADPESDDTLVFDPCPLS